MSFINKHAHRLLKVKERELDNITIHSTNYNSKAKKYFGKKTFIVHNDINGFIDTWNNITSDLHITFLGCSFTECLFMEEKYRFVSIAEKILNTFYNKNIKLLNGGLSGSSIFGSLITVIAKVINHDEIKTVIYVNSGYNYSISHYHYYYYYYSYYNSSIFAETDNIDEPVQTKPANYIQYINFIKVFNHICADFGKKFIFLLRPFPLSNNRFDEANDIAKEICIKNNIPVLDFRKKLEKLGDSIYYDQHHFNAEGSIYFGKILEAIS